jgi:excisionase family DNA binding protein
MATEATKSVQTPVLAEGRRLFDIQAAVAYLRSLGAEAVTMNFVRALVNSGQVPHVRMGRKFYVSRTALDHWITNHERRRS